jgi:hypothetical protein
MKTLLKARAYRRGGAIAVRASREGERGLLSARAPKTDN